MISDESLFSYFLFWHLSLSSLAIFVHWEKPLTSITSFTKNTIIRTFFNAYVQNNSDWTSTYEQDKELLLFWCGRF